MRPVVGVTPLYDADRDSYWMLPGYMKVLEECGALPLMLPLTTDTEELDQAFALCSGLLLTGGQDVDPAYYGKEKLETCGETCPERDRMDGYLLRKALGQDLPVLGICRGIQLMNACLGGDLYQDLPTEHPSGVCHQMQAPYEAAAHDVRILPGTPLGEILGAGIHGVNSCHHQAVRTAAPGVRICAVSEDGLTEVIAAEGQKFCIGVQWHPEFSYRVNEDSRKLVQAFVDAM